MLCAVLCAGCFLVDDPFAVAVAKLINNSICISIAAGGASVCCVTVGCASRSCYYINIAVTLCWNIFGFENSMANGALNMLCSAVYTVGIFICDPV